MYSVIELFIDSNESYWYTIPHSKMTKCKLSTKNKVDIMLEIFIQRLYFFHNYNLGICKITFNTNNFWNQTANTGFVNAIY